MTRRERKIEALTKFMWNLAAISTCKRAKQAAIVVPDDLSAVLAIGYNGPARGLPNDGCTRKKGRCGCIHAEANAVVHLDTVIARSWNTNVIMLCTMMPCRHCAGLIINSNCINMVLYVEEYRDRSGMHDLEVAGIAVDKLIVQGVTS